MTILDKVDFKIEKITVKYDFVETDGKQILDNGKNDYGTILRLEFDRVKDYEQNISIYL